jgi:pimeloyl-ACP methyl ester carboxylesterase
MAGGLVYLRYAPGATPVSVPAGAQAGELVLEPCTYPTGDGELAAECGTLVVPEQRADPGSRLIALPVTRILARSNDPAEPIFYLQGGPGIPNDFDDPAIAARFTDSRDVVLLGYRGVQGSAVLACPEVTRAVTASTDGAGEGSTQRAAGAFAACARRLGEEGFDLAGYTLAERADDMEAARVALGYDRIDLLSESAGTRTAMIYAWRHPQSIHRSVMLAVNPPGHYFWDPQETDAQLRYYAELCAQDATCRARTDDLMATLRQLSADMPDRWLFLPINERNVKVGSFYALMETTPAAGILSGPAALDSWLSAAEGDNSGLWLMSNAFQIFYPDKAWGEQAATGSIDAPYVEDYYASGGDPGSILGNAASDWVMLGGRLADAWPAGESDEQYRQVRPSDVETLLIGGTLDFSTPPSFASEELLPFLRNGQQVVLSDFGHTTTFWTTQPAAGTRLITHFYDTGEVDDSQYVHEAIDFTPESRQTALAKIVVGAMAGLALLTVLSLMWMARRVRRRGRFGPIGGALLRSLFPVVLGLGGWFLGVLIVLTAMPGVTIINRLLMVSAVGTPIGLGVYWAWVHRDWPASTKGMGRAAVAAGTLGGAWLGSHATAAPLALLTAVAGAIAGANLALLLLELWRARPAGTPPAVPPVDVPAPEPAPPTPIGTP